jgi:Domain of unknown function (DUF4124)
MPYPALFIGLLMLFAASPAAAALVKCAGEKGGVIYQDTACPPGKELRDLEADPATVSVVPGTPVPAARTRSVGAPSASSAPAKRATATRTSMHRVRRGNAAERRFIRLGMSEAEVIMRIGRPDVQAKGQGKTGGRRWSYLPAAGDAETLTTLTFAGGQVVDVERRIAR